jgi:restriction endonuclease
VSVETERVKIEYAKRHFETISSSAVTYGVVKNYEELRSVIIK